MLVLYIILGIFIGIPIYLFAGKWILNTVGNYTWALSSLIFFPKEKGIIKINWRDFSNSSFIDKKSNKKITIIFWPIIIGTGLFLLILAILVSWGRIIGNCL
ncbi:MAG: hypothetical protein PHE59_01805 [Patescibacteria group bacterium]|nr:hypothetical protein [Patescibacteria group bacterium]